MLQNSEKSTNIAKIGPLLEAKMFVVLWLKHVITYIIWNLYFRYIPTYFFVTLEKIELCKNALFSAKSIYFFPSSMH